MDRRAWLLGGLVVTAGLVAAAWLLRDEPAWAWLLLWAAVLVLFLSLGAMVTGTWKGIFVNRRNLWSLSQTQMVGWSTLVLGAFTASWFARWGEADPLLVDIPVELLWLMGIAVTGVAGAGAIAHGKSKVDEPVDAAGAAVGRLARHFDAFARDFAKATHRPVRATRRELGPLREHAKLSVVGRQEWDWEKAMSARSTRGLPGLDTRREFLAWYRDYIQATLPEGRLVRNLHAWEASPWDLAEGDEVGNESRGDLGRIQLLILTLIAWAAYAVVLWRHFSGDDFAALPAFSAGLAQVVLLSNGAYLGTKAVPHPIQANADVADNFGRVPRFQAIQAAKQAPGAAATPS